MVGKSEKMDEKASQTPTALTPRHNGLGSSSKFNGQSDLEFSIEAAENNLEELKRQAPPVPSAPQAPFNSTSQSSATADQEGDSKKKKLHKRKTQMV